MLKMQQELQGLNGHFILNKSNIKWKKTSKPAAAALPMAWRVERPLLPTRLLPVPEKAAVPKPSEEDEDEDID